MKISALLCTVLAGLSICLECVHAGEQKETLPVIEASKEKDWSLILSVPMWAAGLDGDLGVRGYAPVGVDLPFYKIFENLEMTASATLELRHQRWGLIFDGLYLKMSGSGVSPGALLSSVDVQLEQVLAEVALAWRVMEGDRGYFDLLAGARYVYLATEFNFQLDSAGVRRVSNQLSDQIVDRALSTIRKEVRFGAEEKAFEDRAFSDIASTISDLTGIERDRIQRKVEGSPGISDARRALVRALVRQRVALAAGEAADQARAKANQAVTKARKQLAKAIEATIRDAVPETVSGSKSWVDPFVGFRGRFYLTESLYLTGRGDIGGFGVGSDLAVNACAGIGCQWSRRFSTDLGYRYLSMDYEKSGFKYDATNAGVFFGVNYEF